MPRDATPQQRIENAHLVDVDSIARRQQNMVDATRAAVQRQCNTIAVASCIQDLAPFIHRHIPQPRPQPQNRGSAQAVLVHSVASLPG